MASEIIYLGNDFYIYLDPLQDKDGNHITNATVQATLYDSAESEVTGVVWPVTLNYVAGSNSRYEGVVDKAAGLALNADYKCKITVLVGGSSDGEFWFDAVARRRVV